MAHDEIVHLTDDDEGAFAFIASKAVPPATTGGPRPGLTIQDGFKEYLASIRAAAFDGQRKAADEKLVLVPEKDRGKILTDYSSAIEAAIPKI